MKNKTRAYHQDHREVANWHYDEASDTYTDLDGTTFTFRNYLKSLNNRILGAYLNSKIFRKNVITRNKLIWATTGSGIH